MRPDIIGVLEDIQEAAGYIAEDTTGLAFEAFARDRPKRQVVERNFEIVGEAVNRLRRQAPEVAQRITAHRQIVDFRNFLIHGYDAIDYPTVWQAVTELLPILRAEVDLLLREVTQADAQPGGSSVP